MEAPQLLIAGVPALRDEELLLETLVELVAWFAAGSGRMREVGQERQAVRRAREYVEASYDRDVTSSELASVAGLNPYHLARVFRAEAGSPPHASVESVRIRQA